MLVTNLNEFTLDEFTRHYIICALWAENDQSDPETGGNPLDDNYTIDNVAPECLEVMIADCSKFQMENVDDIAAWKEPGAKHGGHSAEEMAGYDFWLTRNGHGAGFWDGDWDEEVGKRLTTASDKFGCVNLIIGDDGKIYC